MTPTGRAGGQHADILQVGARKHAEFQSPEGAGEASGKAVMPTRLSATIQEWLLSAEYIMAAGTATSCCASAAPHLREHDAQHHGHLGHPDHQKAQPSSDPRRPESRHGLGTKINPDGPALRRPGRAGIMVEVLPTSRRRLSRTAPQVDGLKNPEQFAGAHGPAPESSSAAPRSAGPSDGREPDAGAPFRRIAIVGVGLIGGSAGG